MTTAPVADQRRLLDVQALDTRLNKLAHGRRSHPTIATLTELGGRVEDLDRARTAAVMLVTDTRREQAKAEQDVEQVRTRAARDAERLNAGAGSPKDLQALQSEIETLGRRQGVLEEIELEVMERLETAERDLAAIEEQRAAIGSQVESVQAEQATAFADLDGEIGTVTASRARLVEGLDAGLLALYERVRAQTGGLAAVALRGEATEGIQVPLSLTERAAIREAPAEEVIRSEDYGYLLIRVED